MLIGLTLVTIIPVGIRNTLLENLFFCSSCLSVGTVYVARPSHFNRVEPEIKYYCTVSNFG